MIQDDPASSESGQGYVRGVNLDSHSAMAGRMMDFIAACRIASFCWTMLNEDVLLLGPVFFIEVVQGNEWLLPEVKVL